MDFSYFRQYEESPRVIVSNQKASALQNETARYLAFSLHVFPNPYLPFSFTFASLITKD